MTKILRFAGSGTAYELAEDVDLNSRTQEIFAAANSDSSTVVLRAPAQGQDEYAYIGLNLSQLAWWTLSEESTGVAAR